MNMLERETILTDRFMRCKPGRPGLVTLTLTETCFTVSKDKNCKSSKTNKKTKVIQIKDIVGCQLIEKQPTNRCRFSVLVSVSNKSKDEFSSFQPLQMVFESPDRTEELTVLWRTEIMKQISQQKNQISTFSLVDRSKKLIVFVNPKSGDGRAIKMFQKSILPALEHSALPYELIITQRPNHGRDFAATQDLSKFSGLVIVSGDGLLHEIVQGLFQREDAMEAIKVPLGIVPAGSGNGLARSLAHINKEQYDKGAAFASVLNLVSGKTSPMDLTRVRTHSGRTYYSFLSIGWGFLADCDIESERLRFMGEPRFALWAAVRVVNLRHYRGRIHYRPASIDHSKESSGSNEWVTIEDDFVSVYCVSLPWIGTSILMAPESTLSDGLLHLVIIRKGVTRLQLSLILQEFESGKHVHASGVEHFPVTAFKLEPLTPKGHLTLDGELIDYGPIEAEVLQGCARIMTK